MSESADVSRERELLKAIHADLLMRSERDSQGLNVVNLSGSLWLKLCELLQEAQPPAVTDLAGNAAVTSLSTNKAGPPAVTVDREDLEALAEAFERLGGERHAANIRAALQGEEE